jgi:hypothetical protein
MKAIRYLHERAIFAEGLLRVSMLLSIYLPYQHRTTKGAE